MDKNEMDREIIKLMEATNELDYANDEGFLFTEHQIAEMKLAKMRLEDILNSNK